MFLVHVVRYFLDEFVFRVRAHYDLLSQVIEAINLVDELSSVLSRWLLAKQVLGFLLGALWLLGLFLLALILDFFMSHLVLNVLYELWTLL